MKRLLLAILILIIACAAAFGQVRKDASPYNYAVGATAGFMNAASFKMFPLNYLAVQADLGYRLFAYREVSYIMHNGELFKERRTYLPVIISINPNVMYEGAIKDGFYWFAGAGVNIGGASDAGNGAFVFGVNAIGGAEYKFQQIPLALQADIRPGFLLFAGGKATATFFDYNFLCISAKYTF